MGKTYKKRPHKFLRRPSGHKKAKAAWCEDKINRRFADDICRSFKGIRLKAVPPNAWDDIPHCNIVHIPKSAAYAMHKQGLPNDEILHKLMKKFNLSMRDAKSYVKTWHQYWWYSCYCGDCISKRKQDIKCPT